MSAILLVFIKNPLLGKAKTRLARTVGDEEALRIYRILLEKTRSAALGVRAERWLFYSDFVETTDDWPETDFKKKVQTGSDLGKRMENAFRQAFDTGADKVLIIGSDCPGLSGALLEEAFDRLDEVDYVLGPASDGGYYLLGMKRMDVSLFRDIAWSTDTVRLETLRKIQATGGRCALLPVLRDVDTEEDWRNAVC